jgi:hypothetical protein
MQAKAILLYNRNMKGVDIFNQYMSYYSYPYKFLKRWKNAISIC